MTELSPAAKAIADAFEEAWRLSDADPFECYVQPLGAALRALAERIRGADGIREDILAIADELEVAQ